MPQRLPPHKQFRQLLAGRLKPRRATDLPRRTLHFEPLEPRMMLHGNPIENPIVTINTNLGSFDIELFAHDTDSAVATPITVNNFLNQVNDGRFINSFFHRLVPGFVLQGGGFFTTAVTPVNPNQITNQVPTDPPIQNEPFNSNVRGTVAMAKLGGDPNSATSQWFVNLGDNSGNLDGQNGGFAAFGRVLDITDVDAIVAGLTVGDSSNINGAFTNIPSSGTLGSGGSLLVVQSIEGTATVHGTKFEDLNGNGIQESGEDGLAGFTIYVDEDNDGVLDPGETSTLTDANGFYHLTAPFGESTIREVQKPDFIQTFPTGSGSHKVVVDNVEIGRDIENLDFGNMREIVVDPPTGIDLLPGSDSGQSDSDNLTNFNNGSVAKALQFSVTGVESGALVRVFADGLLIGQATAGGGTVTVTTTGSSTIADGFRTIVARQVISGVESAASPALGVTIDTTADGFTNFPPTRVNLGDQYLHNVEHQEEVGNRLEYSLGAAPNGMTIDKNTGQIIWTPTAAQAGPNNVLVEATDLAGNVGSQSFIVRVNAPPLIDPIDPVSIDEGSLLTLLISATDPNLPGEDTLNFGLEGKVPEGAAIDPVSGVFTWTPTEAQGPGAFDVTVRVTDEGGLSDMVTFMVDVVDVNLPPVLESIDSQFVEAGTLVTFTAVASDPDLPPDTLTFSLAPGAPAGAEIDPATGQFTWTPSVDQGQQIHSIGVLVTDQGGLLDEQTVEIKVLGVNQPPTLAPIDPLTVPENGELMFTAEAIDPNGDLDTISFSLASGAPAGATIDPSSGDFHWMPTEADGPGTFDITIVAEDALGLKGEKTFSVAVTEVNQTPVIEPVIDRIVTEGKTVELTAAVSDADLPAQDIRFTLDPGAPEGATIDPQTGLFQWTAPRGARGTFAFTIRATDTADSPLSTIETFSVKVVAEVPVVPVFAFAQSLARRTASAQPPPGPLSFLTGPLVTGAGSGVLSQIRSESLARQLAIRSVEAARQDEDIGSGRGWIMPAASNSQKAGGIKSKSQPNLNGDGQDHNQPINNVPADDNPDKKQDGNRAQTTPIQPESPEDVVDQAILEMVLEEIKS